MSDITWRDNSYFIQIELDISGGTDFVIMGTTQLLSVPYSLHSKTAENSFSGNYLDLTNKPTGDNIGDLQYWNGTAWVLLAPGVVGQVLTIDSSNIPSWQNAAVVIWSVPTVINQEATNVQSFSATLNGIVNGMGLTTTVVFDWGLTTNYENSAIVEQSPITGSTDVAVNVDLTELQSATTYQYRIQATNAVNITYSNDLTFTTDLSVPILTTTQVSYITETSVSSGGNITYDGGASVTQRGVCWSISANPTIADNYTSDGSGTGSFTSNITNLLPNTTYYVRAYATNSEGTAYGDNIEFVTFIVTDGLIAYYPFNGNANDESGYGNHGEVSSGHYGFGAGTPVLTTDRFGNANKAYAFNEGAFINVPYTSALNPTQISIALWVNAAEIRENNRFLGLHSWNGYKFQLQSQNKPFFTVATTDGIYDKDSDPALDTLTWYHLAVSFGGGEMAFYVNGVNTVTHTAIPGNLVRVTNHNLSFGVGSSQYADTPDNYGDESHADYHVIPVAWGGYFSGMLDDIRLYNRVLTATEIAFIYEHESP